jgi:hypothetical protein
MKVLIALFVAGLAVAAAAFVADSWLLLLGSVALIGASALGMLIQGWRVAASRAVLWPFLATIAAGLAASALAVGSVVVGVRGDAPGLVLLGVAVVSAAIVAVATSVLTVSKGA